MNNSQTEQKDVVEIADDDVDQSREIVAEFFALIGIDDPVEISADKDNQAILVDIKETDKAGLIIGRKGETIQSLQLILSLIFKNKTDKWLRFLINVADWREKQDARISSLADQAAQRAKQTGQPQHLYNLSSAERRKIHMQLSTDDEIVTESQGEGKERYLVVTVKASSSNKA